VPEKKRLFLICEICEICGCWAERVADLMCELRDRGEFPPFNESSSRWLLAHMGNRAIPNMCPVSGNPLDEQELTRLTHRAREQVFAYAELWRREMPGMERIEVEQTGHGLGVRESRRIRGLKTLDRQMVVEAVKQPLSSTSSPKTGTGHAKPPAGHFMPEVGQQQANLEKGHGEGRSNPDNCLPTTGQFQSTAGAQHGRSEHNQSTTAEGLPVDLRLVVEAWERLPEAVRQGIIAMVKSCAGAARRR